MFAPSILQAPQSGFRERVILKVSATETFREYQSSGTWTKSAEIENLIAENADVKSIAKLKPSNVEAMIIAVGGGGGGKRYQSSNMGQEDILAASISVVALSMSLMMLSIFLWELVASSPLRAALPLLGLCGLLAEWRAIPPTADIYMVAHVASLSTHQFTTG